MILGWYLLGQLVAWCCLPLTWSTCKHLHDRGYALRHPVGLLVTGFLLWSGTAAGLLTNDRQGAFVALAGALLISTLAARLVVATNRLLLAEWLTTRWRLIAIQEGIFLAVFMGWCWVRMHDPAINHTEQPMDLMLLAGTLNSATFPPQDPWLSGFAISYYYFGYWLQALLAQLTGSPPEIAYNLSQAWWLAMVCSGAFGVVFNLLAPHRGVDSVGRRQKPAGILSKKVSRTAVIGGILGAFLVAGAANLDGTLRAVRNLSGSLAEAVPWWWFRSSRVMSDLAPGGTETELITEFPAFSFVLGDNHPHVLFLPFLLLAVAVSLNLLRASAACDRRGSISGNSEARPGLSGLRRVYRSLLDILAGSTSGPPWSAWLLIALVAGSPLVINTWDLPLVWVLLVLPAWVVGRRSASADAGSDSRSWFRPFVHGSAWVVASWSALAASTLILFYPHLLTAQSQARGWLPNLFNPSAPGQFLMIFGAFLPAAGALLLPHRSETKPTWKGSLGFSAVIVAGAGLSLLLGALWAFSSTRGREWLEPYLGEQSLVGLAGGRWMARPVVLVGLALFLGSALARMTSPSEVSDEGSSENSRAADGFVLQLLALALGAILVPELVYLHDVFSARINTVFKFYYQAWILVSLACAYAIVRFRSGAGLRTLLTRVSLVLLLVSSVYPLAALAAKRAEWSGEATLDGLAYLGADERAAIEWIRRWTHSRDVVLQAVGSSYHAEQARASAATGRATLLGWQGHEMQWRGSSYALLAAGRREAVEAVYRSGNAAGIEDAVSRFSIDYIYIGPVERELYGIDADRERLLDELTRPVFSQGDIRILRVCGPPTGAE